MERDFRFIMRLIKKEREENGRAKEFFFLAEEMELFKEFKKIHKEDIIILPNFEKVTYSEETW